MKIKGTINGTIPVVVDSGGFLRELREPFTIHLDLKISGLTEDFVAMLNKGTKRIGSAPTVDIKSVAGEGL
jgi:hypothetical protein